MLIALPLGCGDDGSLDDDGATDTDGTTSHVSGTLTSSTTAGVSTTATTGTAGTTAATTTTEGDATETETETDSDTDSDTEGSSESVGETTGTDTGTATEDTETPGGVTGDTEGETEGETDSTTGGLATIECAPNNGSIVLPQGFCATVFADDLGTARHMAVTPSGDLFVSVAGDNGHVVALRDVDGDGVADEQETFGTEGGNGIAWSGNTLYVGLNDRVERYTLADGELTPSSEPEVVVSDLPMTGDHYAKTVVVNDEGDLFVNVGSATNACQADNRTPGEPGIDPCEELEIRAGVWRFDATTLGQTQADGTQYVRGLRNGNAMAIQPGTGDVWAIVNGRDQLYDNWPDLFTEEEDQRLPAEEVVRLVEDGDYGWPYCYYDPELEQKVLAPEYGGDGQMVSFGDHDCSTMEMPEAVLPAHWAPLGMLFYQGDMFPSTYQNGMFAASHGSRFSPEAETPPGYNVVFIPFSDDAPSAEWEPFATDFAGDARPLPDAAEYRPVGLVEAPDGSLYISDDWTGRIWRVFYTAE